MLDAQGPILVIGAGRSGSTLLARMLDHHEAIQFGGENSFLVARLWLELWEDRFWLNYRRFVDADPRWASDARPDPCDSDVQQEKERVGRIVADCLLRLLDFKSEQGRAWGYKEVWNGTARYNYAWYPYDLVFPGAVWVHLVRNPFEFARSCADWNRDDLTVTYLRDRLRDWKAVVERSRERKDTGRFIEIRYEDLVRTPELALAPVLERVGLSWSESCGEAVKIHRLRSTARRNEARTDPVMRRTLEECVGLVPGLEALVGELGYTLPPGFEAAIVEEGGGEPLAADPSSRDRSGDRPLDQPHKPQHLMKQEMERLEAHCHRLEQERDYYRSECDRFMGESLLGKIMSGGALGRKLKGLLEARRR